jgi:hypothetical protein
VVRALLGEYRAEPFDGDPGRAAGIIDAVREVHREFWPV